MNSYELFLVNKFGDELTINRQLETIEADSLEEAAQKGIKVSQELARESNVEESMVEEFYSDYVKGSDGHTVFVDHGDDADYILIIPAGV